MLKKQFIKLFVYVAFQMLGWGMKKLELSMYFCTWEWEAGGKSQRSRFTCNYVLLMAISSATTSGAGPAPLLPNKIFHLCPLFTVRPPRSQLQSCSSWQMKLFLFIYSAEECSAHFPSDGGASKKRQPFSLSICFQLLQQTFGTIIFTKCSIDIIFSLMAYLFGQHLIEF